MGWQSWKKAKEVKIGDPFAKSIYLYLAECLNENTGQCNPSQETIAEECEISLPSVKRKLKMLTKLGLILPSRNEKNKRIFGTNYEVFYGITETPSEADLMVSDSQINGISQTPYGITVTPLMVSDSQINGISVIPKQEENGNIEQEEHTQENEAVCADFQDFAETCLTGLRKIQNLNIISDEAGWLRELERIFINNFTPDQVFETYRLTRQQHWRGGRITPKIVADNISDLDNLRIQIGAAIAQNGNGNGNYTNPATGKQLK